MTVLGWIAGVAAFVYLLSAVLLFTVQRRLIYPTPNDGAAALRHPGSGFERVEVRTADGLTLGAAYRAPRAGRPTIIFFHGNGDSVAGGVVAMRALSEQGYGILLAEYRGYAGNPGTLDEAGLYADAVANADWLAARGVPASDTIVIGNSIGGGVATELATRRRVKALVLISPFTSLPDVATAGMLRVFPRWLVRDRFDNAGKLPRVDAPVLILHGSVDTLIPAYHALRLAATRPVTLRLFPDRGHELAYQDEAGTAIVRWLESEVLARARYAGCFVAGSDSSSTS